MQVLSSVKRSGLCEMVARAEIETACLAAVSQILLR